MSYHLRDIPKGILGEFSKIEEEFLEFLDAIEQNNILMALIELSDMLGAIQYYKEKYQLENKKDDVYITHIPNTIQQMQYHLDSYKLKEKLVDLNLLETNIYHWCLFYNITKDDLVTMSNATSRAFKSGRRK